MTRNLGTEPKGSDEIDDFGSAFEGMEKRAEREGRRNQDKVYNLSPLFEMNTPEAIKKRAEREEKRNREDSKRKLPEPMRKPDAKGDEKRIEDED